MIRITIYETSGFLTYEYKLYLYFLSCSSIRFTLLNNNFRIALPLFSLCFWFWLFYLTCCKISFRNTRNAYTIIIKINQTNFDIKENTSLRLKKKWKSYSIYSSILFTRWVFPKLIQWRSKLWCVTIITLRHCIPINQ